MGKNPRVFIGYAWESEQHKHWVGQLADQLRAHDINVRFDQWHNPAGEISLFIEQECATADIFIPVVTPTYVDRANRRQGATGAEVRIISSRQMRNQPVRCIPVFVRNPTQELPLFLAGSAGVTFPDAAPGMVEAAQLASMIKNEKYPSFVIGPWPRKFRFPSLQTIAAAVGVLLLAVIAFFAWPNGVDLAPGADSATAVPTATNTPDGTPPDDAQPNPTATAPPDDDQEATPTPQAEPTPTATPIAGSEPTQVPSPTPAPIQAALASTPPELVGVWEGTAFASDGNQDGFQISVIVGSGQDVRWSVSFGSCSGTLSEVAAEGTASLSGTPRFSTGQENCTAGRTLGLQLDTIDAAVYTWESLDGTSTATGTLQRWAGVDPTNDHPWPTQRRDLSSTFSAWVGTCIAGTSPPCPPSGFIQDWSACDGDLCVVGFSRDNIQIFAKDRPFRYIKNVDATAINSTVELILQGLPPSAAMSITG